jgi:hypothetical protein
MIRGMKKEEMKSASAKKTFSETSCPQFPDAQTCFRVPPRRAITTKETEMPKPVPPMKSRNGTFVRLRP